VEGDASSRFGRLELDGPEAWLAVVDEAEQLAWRLASLCFPIAQAADPKLIPTAAVIELLD